VNGGNYETILKKFLHFKNLQMLYIKFGVLLQGITAPTPLKLSGSCAATLPLNAKKNLPMVDKILEHEKHLHDKVEEVLPARLGGRLQLADVGGEVGRAHQAQHCDHVAHQRSSIPVILTLSNSFIFLSLFFYNFLWPQT
jgi:hypothetical protein